MAHPLVELELVASGQAVIVNALQVDMLQPVDANSAIIIASGVEYLVRGDFDSRVALIRAALHHT